MKIIVTEVMLGYGYGYDYFMNTLFVVRRMIGWGCESPSIAAPPTLEMLCIPYSEILMMITVSFVHLADKYEI